LKAQAKANYDNQRLSRPLLYGFVLLASIPVDGSYVRDTELAWNLGFSQYRVDRLLKTLTALKLLECHPETRLYRLSR
jgi:DNA-binding IclR family transcriptional regulator